MAFLGVRKLDDAPILIMSYSGHVTAADIDTGNQQLAPYFESPHEDRVLIIDTTETSTSTFDFRETLSLLKHLSGQRMAQNASDDLHVFVVGTDTMTRFLVDSSRLKQFGGMQTPLFASLEVAITAARRTLASSKTEKAT